MAKSDKPTLVQGIRVDVAADAFDDFEVLECIADVYDEDSSDDAKTVAAVKLFRLVFGADFKRIKDALRKQHGGKLSVETMNGFMGDVIEAVNAKN